MGGRVHHALDRQRDLTLDLLGGVPWPLRDDHGAPNLWSDTPSGWKSVGILRVG